MAQDGNNSSTTTTSITFSEGEAGGVGVLVSPSPQQQTSSSSSQPTSVSSSQTLSALSVSTAHTSPSQNVIIPSSSGGGGGGGNIPHGMGANLVAKPAKRIELSGSTKDFIAGTIGGSAQLVAGHPFDTIKVRLQQPGSERLYVGPMDCLRKTIAVDGMLGLFKGMSSPLVGVAAVNAVLFVSYGHARRWLIKKRKNHNIDPRLSVAESSLAGMFAGLINCAVICPVELVKARLQVQSNISSVAAAKAHVHGYAHSSASSQQTETATTSSRSHDNTTNSTTTSTKSTVSSISDTKSSGTVPRPTADTSISPHSVSNVSNNSVPRPTAATASLSPASTTPSTSSSTTTTTRNLSARSSSSTFSSNKLFLLASSSSHSRLALPASSWASSSAANATPAVNAHYTGPMSVIRAIHKTHGPLGLFRGMMATIYREVPAYAAYFGVYSFTKQLMTPKGSTEQDLGPMALFFAGGIGGVACWMFSYPQDVIKTRLQTQPDSRSGSPKYKPNKWLMDGGFFDCARQIYREEGMRAFWRGFSPTIIRAYWANAVTFLIYELSMRVLDKL